MTSKLYSNGNKLGLDAASLDIERGRDHGLPVYNYYRRYCGLPAAKTFDDFLDYIPIEVSLNNVQAWTMFLLLHLTFLRQINHWYIYHRSIIRRWTNYVQSMAIPMMSILSWAVWQRDRRMTAWLVRLSVVSFTSNSLGLDVPTGSFTIPWCNRILSRLVSWHIILCIPNHMHYYLFPLLINYLSLLQNN